MFTLSAFADEISPDPKAQIDILKTCGVRHIEFRSILGINVLALSDLQIDEFQSLLKAGASSAWPSHKTNVGFYIKPRSRVGRSRRIERLGPMTVRLRPLIKPDGRISRIRLSEPLSSQGIRMF